MFDLRHFLCQFTLVCLGILNKGTFASSRWATSFQDSRESGWCQFSRTITENIGDYDLQQDLFTLHKTDKSNICLYFRPKDGNPIKLTFTEFKFGFPDSNGSCSLNFIAFGDDKDNIPSYSRRRYCGFSIPTFTSSSGFAWVWIHRSSTYYSKLTLHYSTVPKCGGDISFDSYTHVVSPRGQYRGYDCEWTVSLRPNNPPKPLQIQITNWTVGWSPPFGTAMVDIPAFATARVDIYDGIEGHQLASFDQSTDPVYVSEMLLTTSGPQVRITFFLDRSVSHSATAFLNATIKVKGFCVPGTVSCGDGEKCYSENQICDGRADCSTGFDELGCKPCLPTEFWCGASDVRGCYTADERCNGYKDCRGIGQDEVDCESCRPGTFLCKSGKNCIYEKWLCDGDADCTEDGSDEDGCSYEASRKVITAAIIGSLICCLLLVISLGCTCKLYSLRASHHRHPHHHYRATPLTRVEREIFARQAPPTYDMTLTGSSTENARSQRGRRRRSRRYQFERTAPANIGHQSNINSRQEGVQRGNAQQGPTPPQSVPTPLPPPLQTPNATGAQSSPSPALSDRNIQSTLLQHFGSFLFDSTRTNAQGQSSSMQRSSTPVPVATQNSGTQTRAEAQNPQPSGNSSRAPSSGTRRQGRGSSSSRSRRSTTGDPSTSSPPKDQQAKPLPKKRRIHPVKVSAPLATAAVEENMLACVYPCPPSYSQAVATGTQSAVSPTQATASGSQAVACETRTAASELETVVSDILRQDNVAQPTLEDSQSSSNVESSREDSATDFSSTREEPPSSTRSRSILSSLSSLSQAFRNVASASIARFRRNPYVQITAQDSRRDSDQGGTSLTSVADDGRSFILPAEARNSTSSDEDMLDCSLANGESLRRDRPRDPSTSAAVTTDTPTTSSGKLFPKKTLTFFRPAKNGVENHDLAGFTLRMEK